ncbi:MAG: alanine racemase [Methylococcales bacterium]|nr:alanine racemase [Methylococcales bacterium]
MTPITYATINLSAIEHNLTRVRYYAPKAQIMAVIKADGYGHGLLQVAEALKHADAFAVARINEAMRLRYAGFKQRLVVLEGFMNAEELDVFIQYNLDPVVHCVEQVALLEKKAETSLFVWLKLDTGMNRLGFKSADFSYIYQRVKDCVKDETKINVMTHLANADDKKDTKTLAQIDLFKTIIKGVKGQRSMANSAGILEWTAALSDWVRPGLMLYGISPFENEIGKQFNLKPVMSLYSQLIAIKTLQKGETVGYGSTWIAEKTTRIGIVGIGYGDGYPRHAKTGTPMLIKGKQVPLVGRVSMDMITVDLSSQLEAAVYDSVMLWGDDLAVEDIATCAGTIAYTLVCGVTARVPRLEIK